MSHVDDIVLIATSAEALVQALRQSRDFENTFCLDVSLLKSHVWGLHPPFEHCGDMGKSVKDTVEALGQGSREWALYPTSKRRHERGLKRIDRALDRLRRLSHLPAPLMVKAHAVFIGCLSLLAHAPTLPPSRSKSLRSAVRKALSLSSGAPEVIFGASVRSSLDPRIHWLMTALRMWRFKT